jgi:pyruvate dehydrogenase E2 component (dihydrolipoamide acetyltransferase)
MPIDIKLPDLGDGIDSGDVLDVLVREGDQIKKDQGILELETDKATVEVPTSHAGTVIKVHVKSGQTVPIGATLITLEAAAGAPVAEKPAAAPSKPAAPAPKPAAKAAPTAPPKAPAAQQPAAKPQPPAPTPPKPAPAAKPAPTPAPQPVTPAATTSEGDNGLIAAGPAVRRFAREVGVELSNVKGTGPSGRITRDDVLEVVREANQEVARSGAAAKRAAVAGTEDAWGPIRYETLTKIRKTIAAKMHESWSTVPRVTNFDDADVTDLENFRKSSKADYAAKGIKLTSMPFVIKAVAMALKSHPALNAAIDLPNDRVIYKEYVNIGIAVDSDRGLVVPSLRHADDLSIAEIARGLTMLADNVRNSSFTIDDLRGSTFTISNLGAIGGTYSTPIINTPEVAILLVGRSRKLPVVIEDKIVPRLMMPLSLAYDHRLVDGATAARFLNDVIGFLQAPSRLLLAP